MASTGWVLLARKSEQPVDRAETDCGGGYQDPTGAGDDDTPEGPAGDDRNAQKYEAQSDTDEAIGTSKIEHE